MASLTFELGSGRRVSVNASEETTGHRLVVFCHPVAGAAGFDPDPTVTARLGAQIVGVNRPGYAASERLAPSVKPSVEQFADDIAEYLRHLRSTATSLGRTEVERVGVVGWSFGGYLALSLAARHPDLVGNAAVVGTSRPARVRRGDPNIKSLEFSPRARGTSVDRMIARLSTEPPFTLGALGISEDNPVLRRPGLRNRLDHMLDDAFAQGIVGVATDRVASRNTSWTRELSRMSARTLIVHGREDAAAGGMDRRWLRRRISNARTIAIEGAGHLAVVSAWGTILDHVTSEDWPRFAERSPVRTTSHP